MADHKNVQFGIADIRLVEFFVDESKTIEAAFDLNYKTDINFHVAENVIRINITATFMRKENREIFMRGNVETIFTINDLKSYAIKKADGKDAIDLPDGVWVTLFSLSYSHARALLAHCSGRSQFVGLLLPIINPTAEFKKLFAQQLQKDSEIDTAK